tara:strand:+ start:622 stop:1017 length:396 start_codon:yes stop_codon:yes gene_type:complete
VGVSYQPGINATLTMNPLKRDITNDDLLPLLEVIEEIRVRDPEMTAAVLSIFLYVATHDDCHKQAIEEDLEISTSNCSRAADWLLDKKTLRKPGLGLITKELDPSNKRRVMFSLTQQGRHLANRLKTSLYG